MDLEKLKNDAALECQDRESLQSKLADLRNICSGERERSLAKTTKALNRIKKFYTEPNLSGLVSEISRLDLTVYMQELVTALNEAMKGMKLKDTFQFVEVCIQLHPFYNEFGESLLNSLKKLLDGFMNDNLRLRLFVRVLTELILLRIIPTKAGEKELVSIIEAVLIFDPDETSLAIAVTRLTALTYWIGKYSALVDSFESKSQIRSSIKSFYELKAPRLLDSVTEAVSTQEKVNAQNRIDKGQAEPDNEAKLASLSTDLTKIRQLVESMRILMGFVSLETISTTSAEAEKSTDIASSTEEPVAIEITQFADETEKSFYQDLPDLKARLPASLLADAVPSASDHKWSDFLKQFQSLNSKDSADDLAIIWFESGFNSKGNRKQLFSLFNKEASPVHSRFLASIAPFNCSEVVASIVEDLKKRCLLEYQDRAIKTVGEFTKFSLCPLGVSLELMQTYVNDFSSKSAEAASWLLISCGRFLINHPDVGTVVDNLLTRLVKLTRSSSLPAKVVMAVDDAYYQAKPRRVFSIENESTVPVSPLEKYIQYLAQVEIYRMDEEEVLRLIRRLPWSGESGRIVKNCLKSAILQLGLNANYVKVYCIASLLAGLVKYQEEFVVDVIDTVLEQFQVGIEKEDFRQAPSRMRLARLIAELYAFKLIDSFTVLDILYQLIGFRSSSSYGASEHTVLREILVNEFSEVAGLVDEPSWSFVRINLVATILTTVCEFFHRGGKNRSRILRFLVLFRRYLYSHCQGSPVPTRIVNVVNDLFELLHVKGFDIRSDSIERIETEIDLIKSDLMTNESQIALNRGTDESSGSSDEAADCFSPQQEENTEDSPPVDDESSDFESRSDRGEEFESFEKEMQALMIDSVAEARAFKKPPSTNLRSLNFEAALSAIDEPAALCSGGFRVLSKSMGGKAIAGGLVVVPQDNKLRKGQEIYKFEQEAAAREKEQLKQYIMAYERASNDPTSVPTTGHAVTLGQAAGIRAGQIPARPKRVFRRP